MRLFIPKLFKRRRIFSLDEACANACLKLYWPNGFVCSKCGETSAWFFNGSRIYQCSKCRHRVSVTIIGILLDLTNLYCLKDYFVALCCRITKKLAEQEQTAELMARKVFMNSKFIWLIAAVAAYNMYCVH